MSCQNPEHPDAGPACGACYAAVCAELTALNDRYARLLAENSELERRVRDSEQDGTAPTFHQYGATHLTWMPGGFELASGQAYVQGRPRSRPASEDSLLLTFGSRTTGPRGSILLERPDAEVFHDLTGRWLQHGWPGVDRKCGAHYRPDRLHDWKCELPPGHLDAPGAEYIAHHQGHAIGWPSAGGGKPGPARWTRAGEWVPW